MNGLAHSVSNYSVIRERLLADHEDLDEETLADTLEGITDLHEVIAAVVRAALDDEAHAEGVKRRISDMQTRLERLQTRARRRRQAACEAMAEAEIRKITACDLTLSIRPGSPALVVTDESAIPEPYWRPAAPRLDRRALLDDLKGGASVVGAALSNPAPVLSVRTK